MGGINCPPPKYDNFEPASPQVVGEYVHKLADYSANLFGGVAAFYDANAKIEVAVLGATGIGSAIDALSSSEELLAACQIGISPVASLWGTVSPGNPVDFMSQDRSIGHAVQAVREARSELADLPTDGGLQAAIWGKPAITDCLVAASNALADAVAWQTQFATLSSAALALVA